MREAILLFVVPKGSLARLQLTDRLNDAQTLSKYRDARRAATGTAARDTAAALSDAAIKAFKGSGRSPADSEARANIELQSSRTNKWTRLLGRLKAALSRRL